MMLNSKTILNPSFAQLQKQLEENNIQEIEIQTPYFDNLRFEVIFNLNIKQVPIKLKYMNKSQIFVKSNDQYSPTTLPKLAKLKSYCLLIGHQD